jgi:hypothetical protein
VLLKHSQNHLFRGCFEATNNHKEGAKEKWIESGEPNYNSAEIEISRKPCGVNFNSVKPGRSSLLKKKISLRTTIPPRDLLPQNIRQRRR